MQLLAREKNHRVVHANQASKQQDYYCLECGSIVRRRGGIHRQNHFYHVDPERPCRQKNKSMEHIQVQCHLENLLPSSQLEVVFKSINRIADVVWKSEKIIFEIQCSPISPDEIRSRNEDYDSLGYQVIWILHTRRYNRLNLSGAEIFLRSRSHYFTDINEDGEGMIFDQFDLWGRGCRKFKLAPLPISVVEWRSFKDVRKSSSSKLVSLRLSSWPIYFKGDLVDTYLENLPYIVEVKKLEEPPLKEKRTFWNVLRGIWYWGIVRPYFLCLQMMIERACR